MKLKIFSRNPKMRNKKKRDDISNWREDSDYWSGSEPFAKINIRGRERGGGKQHTSSNARE